MPLSDERLNDLASLPDLIKPLLPLAGLANPAIATVTFAYGMLMRVVRIGTKIRQELDKQQKSLLSDIKAQGLFRVPITVNTDSVALHAFLGMGRRRFPRALQQLEADVLHMKEPFHPEQQAARERLTLAMHVIPKVYDRFERTGQLRLEDDPLLGGEHLHLLNPGEPTVYRALVDNLHLERKSVLVGETASLGLVRERLPMYVLLRLQMRQDALDEARSVALADFQGKVRNLYWDMVFGENDNPGVLEEAVEFIVTRSTERIDEELEALGEEREHLQAAPEEERDQARLDAITAREQELNDLKERVAGAREP